MKKVSWRDLGFSDDEVRLLDDFRRDEGSLSVSAELAAWEQWVAEIERGDLLTMAEIQSAWDMRDDLEESCGALEESLRFRIFTHLDDLDVRYRDSTVFSGLALDPEDRGRWWRNRIPIGNAARTFMCRAESGRVK